MRPVGFFIWFSSGVKAFQTRAVPVSVKGDPEAKQKRPPCPHSEQVIYQKARSYDRFLNFFCQKVVKMRQRFFFLCFRFSAEHSFLCCCVKLIFQKFSTIFRKNIHFHFPVRIFTAPPVSPDMQNTPPNFEILAVYFEAKRWYIKFVRTFCGQRTCIHAAVSKRRDNFDREVIGVFWYHCVMERLYHPACGAYTSFGIAACSTSHGRHRKLRFISDVSVDPVRVLRLAARCTACQLDPSQLMDVVEDLLAE